MCEAPTHASVMHWGHFLVLLSQEDRRLGPQADPRQEEGLPPPRPARHPLPPSTHTSHPALRTRPARPGSLWVQASPKTVNEEEEGEEINHSWFVGKIETNRIRQDTGSRWGARGRKQTSGKRGEIWEDQRGQVLTEQSSDPTPVVTSVLKPLEPGPGCPCKPLADGATLGKGTGSGRERVGGAAAERRPPGTEEEGPPPVILPLGKRGAERSPKAEARGVGG